jgi:hypothetical protein
MNLRLLPALALLAGCFQPVAAGEQCTDPIAVLDGGARGGLGCGDAGVCGCDALCVHDYDCVPHGGCSAQDRCLRIAACDASPTCDCIGSRTGSSCSGGSCHIAQGEVSCSFLPP